MTRKTSIGTITASLDDGEGFLELSADFKALPWIIRADILQDILIAVSDEYEAALKEGKAVNWKTSGAIQ